MAEKARRAACHSRKINRPIAPPPSASIAVLDREGMVIATLASQVEARAFLRGGCA